MRFYAFILLFVMLTGIAAAQVPHSCPLYDGSRGSYENPLYDRWLSAYDIKFYHLRLEVSDTTTYLEGSATLLLVAERAIDTVVLELQDALEVTGVAVSERAADTLFMELTGYTHQDDAVFIPLERSREAGELFQIVLHYRGDAGQERGFFAGVSNRRDPTYGFDVTYTLSEPHNAKDWFPVKQVLEDKIDSAHVTLICHEGLMAASNGVLEGIVPVPDGKHEFRWRSAYPVAYYLLSFAVADYRDLSFRAPLPEGDDSVLVQNYIYDTDQVMLDWEDEIRGTGPMITLFSDLLMDYPFSGEKYGHAMAPLGGGMEHQTMTTIHDFSFYLVAHELAHQWFGDYITCGNWQDIWINEGFASYMEYVAAQGLLGQQAADGWMANAVSIALGETSGSVHVPEEQVEDTYRLFDYGLTYKKGAVLLHMIRYLFDNDELFFGVLRSYLDQIGNGLATAEDFRKILETESGMDFSCFFDQWYYGEGFPSFNLQWYQQGDTLIMFSEQGSSAPTVTPFFHTPFDVEVRFEGGDSERHRLIQDRQLVRFSLPVDGRVQDLIFDPDGWLLKTSTVTPMIPPDRTFIFGPNPVTGELFIQFSHTSQIDEILITTMEGKEVVRHRDASNPVFMDLSTLTNGAYMLVMKQEERTYLECIVKVSR